MSKQVTLKAEPRSDLGKGPTGRLRRTGRVPGIVYGYAVDPTPVHVDSLELYHVLHTEAGRNVMIRLDLDGDTTLVLARDLQVHPIRQEVVHVDFLAVDRDAAISVEVPVHLVGEDDTADDDGVLNQVLYTVPISVKPLDVPNYLELDVTGMAINDVKRVEDLTLPSGAEFEVDLDVTVVTVNAPISEEALEALEAELEGDVEDADEDAEATDEDADAAEGDAEGDEAADEEA